MSMEVSFSFSAVFASTIQIQARCASLWKVIVFACSASDVLCEVIVIACSSIIDLLTTSEVVDDKGNFATIYCLVVRIVAYKGNPRICEDALLVETCCPWANCSQMLKAISLPLVDTLLPDGFPAWRKHVVQILATRLVVALGAGRTRLVDHS